MHSSNPKNDADTERVAHTRRGAILANTASSTILSGVVRDANVEGSVSWTLKPSGTCANRNSCGKQKAIVCVCVRVCVCGDRCKCGEVCVLNIEAFWHLCKQEQL
jgi:hypothetical protein